MPTVFRPWALRAALLTVNIVGLIWIHHDLTAGRRLRIVAALPTQEVDATDRFTLVFDRPLPIAGTPGAVLAESPFIITPAIAGQWTWSLPERLEYRLERPLPPGKRFIVRAAAGLERLTGRTLSGQTEFQFQTHPLQLLACNVASSDDEHANLELEFNQPVDPSDLQRHLRATDVAGSQVIRGQVLSRSPAEKLTIRLPHGGAERLLLTLDADLTGSGAELPLGHEVRRDLDLRSDFTIVKAQVDAGGLEANTCVNIRFSRPLQRAAEAGPPSVTLTPALANLEVRTDYNAVCLTGPFECHQRYTATFGADLQSADKQPLGQRRSISFDIPDRKPALAFKLNSGVLSPSGNLLLDLKVVNVPTLRLRASRVHANNLVAHLRGDRRDHTSRELPEKTVSIEAPRNVPTAVTVDLRELLHQPLGVYWVEASGPEGSWLEDSAIVAITDLAITSKAGQARPGGRDGFCVWVTSLRTAKPVPAAEVSAMSYNGQVLATAKTDANGLARLAVPPGHPDGKAWVLAAARGDDVSFLQPEEHPWVLDGVDQSGRSIPTSYDTMLYTERGVYRPGETIHLTGIIRDCSGSVPPSFPLAVSIRRPDGKEVAQLPVKAAEQGIFHVDYATPEQARTGPYLFEVALPGAADAKSRDVLGRTEALVEEYVPQRMELKAVPAMPRFGPNDEITLSLAARYLFEQPAAGLVVKVAGEYQREIFKSKRFPGFCFESGDKLDEVKIDEQDLTLDAAGRATAQVDGPGGDEAILWRATLTATVTEEGGHSVCKHVNYVVDLQDRHVGLRLPGGKLAVVGSPVAIDWVQLTGADELAEPSPASYSLQLVNQDVTLEEVDGRPVWKTVEQVTTVTEGEVAAPGTDVGHFTTTCPGAGLYRLILKDCYSGAAAEIDFRAADEQDATYASALNHPEQLDIALDKETYAPGSTAKVLVKSPFPGTLLVTLETDRVIESRVLELASASAELELPVSETLRGGAFLTATVVRQIDPSDRNWLPHRAMGMVRLRTDTSAHNLPVRIVAPRQARPSEPIRVRVETNANPQHSPMVHLWAADEGILLATSYATPQPGEHFFASRESGVGSADSFGDLLPDQQRPASTARIGGDAPEEAAEHARRMSPVPAPRRTPVVVWRRTVPLGTDGSITADIELPEFTGAIRLMAVAVENDRYGSAEAAVTVSSPLMVEASWPRFAAPGDRFDVPVKLFNTTGEPLLANISVLPDGPLQVESPNAACPIEPSGSATVWLRTAATGLGPVTVKVQAVAPSATVGTQYAALSTQHLFVRPATPLEARSRLVCLKAGEPLKLDPAAEFLPGTAQTTIAISGQPAVQLQPAVEELLDYPYGCVEQTTSRLYVLLYAPELLRDSPGRDEQTRNIGDMLQAGLARLWSMQTRSGGLSYWPGESEPTLWGSCYAAEFLIRAKAAGHKIDATFLTELAKYLQSELEHPSDEEMDANLRAQVCCVLAALHKPPQGWMARLSEQLGQLDIAGRAHLAAAWLAAGRKDRALAMLSEDTLAQTVATTTSGRLTSQVQQEAALLNTLLDLDRNHPWVAGLVQRLEKARRSARWGSTLENASALAALARYQLTATQEPAHFAGTVRQGTQQWPFDNGSVRTLKLAADQPVEVVSTGQGSIYVSLTTQGLLRDIQAPEYDRQLHVSRRWTDRAGKPVDPAKIKVGDLIHVETSLITTGEGKRSGIDNIATVDALPGGMEVENPRLSGSADTSKHVDPDRVEFRDDRVVIFSSAGREKTTFRYCLRAITAGSFVLPPIQASCMYDAAVASLHGSGRVEIAK